MAIEFLANLVQAFTLPLKDPIIAFSLILFIILLAPLLLKRINVPGIIGLIVAGILIGPHGLGILGPEALHEGSGVTWFSTIGLLYIMFIAGLELDMGDFRKNRNKSLTFGLLTFSIPLAIGYPVCRYLLGFDFNASLLTASMFATHTLVAYPIVGQFGVSKNPAVAITVGGTILTDGAVLLMLSVIMGNSRGDLNQEFWIQLGVSLAIFTAIMLMVIPRLAEWFFRVLENEKHSHYIFVLSVMFFAAFLAKVAGFEGIIGAFVAGLALNRLIPASSALMNRIEFMGNSLFIPFFLIGVGMIVDARVIFSGLSAWVVAGTLTFVAVAGKWIASFLTQQLFHYSGSQRQLIFGLSSAHAAATLAIIMVGHTAGILDDSILNGTIILILITSTLASFATEKAAREIAATQGSDHDSLIKTSAADSEHILIPIKDVGNMEKFLEFGVLIKDKKSPHPLSVLTVVSNNAEAEINLLKAKEKLEGYVKEASATETQASVLTTIDQNVASGVARVSREIMADIIILGWPHRTGFFDRIIRDRIGSILNNTYKTTFICHFEKPLALHKRIVVCVPPQAELEYGFPLWLAKMHVLSQELTAELVIYCDEPTRRAIEHYNTFNKPSGTVTIKHFSEWEDFLILSRSIGREDLVVLVSARYGAKSHMRILDGLPGKLERYFPDNNYLVVYPQHVTNPLLHALD